MSFLRPHSSRNLSRICSTSRTSSILCPRRFSQIPPHRLGEPDPRAIPDVEAMQATEDQASMIVAEHVDPLTPSIPSANQPDWNAEIDHGTSLFSPVPRRVLDGSEPGDTTPAAVVSGAPVDLQARTVRIYKPVRPATQSGTWGSHAWRMDWDILSKGHRWENPLMGWQSSADSMQGYNLKFNKKEDAIAFAEKQGYEYYVQEPNERRFTPKAYANNFVHEFKPLKHIKTK